jgi:hypothetical protein
MYTVIDIPIYSGVLIILLTDKHSDIAAISGHIQPPYEDIELLCYTYRDFVYENNPAVMIVFNFKNSLNPITLNEIVHEIEHAGNDICRRSGIQVMSGMDEPAAYLKGWIASKFQDFLVKNNLQNELFKKR